MSGFFGLDVIVSAVVLWVFVGSEGRRLGVRGLWAPVAASLLVGVSLGLPLFLYLRERRLEEGAPPWAAPSIAPRVDGRSSSVHTSVDGATRTSARE